MHLTRIINTSIKSDGKVYLRLSDNSVLRVIDGNCSVICKETKQVVQSGLSFEDIVTGDIYTPDECLYDDSNETLIGFIW